jgi:hypothetical protein
MILILAHHTGNESCSSTEIFPFEYKSKEDFEIDFEIACEEALKEEASFEFFQGYSFHSSEFFIPEVVIGSKSKKEQVKGFQYYGPEVYTLEEWLARETKKVKI